MDEIPEWFPQAAKLVRTHLAKTRTQTVLDATCDLVKVRTLSLAVHFAFGDLTVRHARHARPAHFCVWQARLGKKVFCFGTVPPRGAVSPPGFDVVVQ